MCTSICVLCFEPYKIYCRKFFFRSVSFLAPVMCVERKNNFMLLKNWRCIFAHPKCQGMKESWLGACNSSHFLLRVFTYVLTGSLTTSLCVNSWPLFVSASRWNVWHTVVLRTMSTSFSTVLILSSVMPLGSVALSVIPPSSRNAPVTEDWSTAFQHEIFLTGLFRLKFSKFFYANHHLMAHLRGR